jgi:hypothetical protein
MSLPIYPLITARHDPAVRTGSLISRKPADVGRYAPTHLSQVTDFPRESYRMSNPKQVSISVSGGVRLRYSEDYEHIATRSVLPSLA